MSQSSQRRKRGLPPVADSLPEEPSTSRSSSIQSSDHLVDKFITTMTEFLKRASEQGPTSTVNGDVVPTFDPESSKITVNSWCQKIDELREIYNWSEEATIYYAMNKLRGLAEMWYKSLPTLKFSWEEWKEKLENGFPSKKNYCLDLQEMLNRKKRTEETYTKYYYEKISLLNKCKIFGEDAVSCIIGGITDVVVKTGASAGNHKSPETLYVYLSSINNITLTSRSTIPPTTSQRKPYDRFGRNNQLFHRSRKVCYICKQPGHTFKFCRKTQKSNENTRKCNYCQRTGHLEESCYLKKNQKPQPKI